MLNHTFPLYQAHYTVVLLQFGVILVVVCCLICMFVIFYLQFLIHWRYANKIYFTPHFKGKRRCINAIWHCCAMLRNPLTRNEDSIYNTYTPSWRQYIQYFSLLGRSIHIYYLNFSSMDSNLLQHFRQQCAGLQLTVSYNEMECSGLAI